MSEIPSKFLIESILEDMNSAHEPIEANDDITELPEDEEAKESL